MADDSKTIIDEEPIENIQDEESGEDEGNTEELKDQESAVEDMPDQEPAADDGSDEGSIKTLAYTAKTWKTNDVIEADNLNAIEKELSSVSSSIDELNTNLESPSPTSLDVAFGGNTGALIVWKIGSLVLARLNIIIPASSGTTSGANTLDVTLPSGYRPTTAAYFSAFGSGSGTIRNNMRITVNTDGTLTFLTSANTANAELYVSMAWIAS